ncbi:MAG: response regulator [Elusimicrobiota bacterium]
MVIEDDNGIREMLRIALSIYYDISAFANGDDIAALLDKNDPDLLLLDINLPGSDGFRLCESIRSRAKDRGLPILFMTVRRENRSFLESLESGGDGVITKPFVMKELVDRIETLLKGRL